MLKPKRYTIINNKYIYTSEAKSYPDDAGGSVNVWIEQFYDIESGMLYEYTIQGGKYLKQAKFSAELKPEWDEYILIKKFPERMKRYIEHKTVRRFVKLGSMLLMLKPQFRISFLYSENPPVEEES